jgi:ankyrin repeat protein
LAAAAAGNAEDTLFYLEQGARPGTSDAALYTPLHFAARSGDKDTIALLLKYKDTIWYADGNATPLHLAARHGHAAAVRQITSISNHDWPKERASSPHAIEKIKTAMNHKFDNHLKAFFERKTYSAREIAVIYNQEAAALAFPMASNDDLPHAFSDACMMGNVKMMETLWKHNQQRPYRDTHSKLTDAVRWFPAPPLHLAVMSGNRAAVAFLLEKGVKATGGSSSTWNEAFPPYSSPAHYAAIVGSAELLKALERRKVSLTIKDFQDRTPLSYAVEHQNEDVVELLVKRKHRDGGGIFSSTNSAAYSTYFGDGHLAQIPGFKLDEVKSSRIKKVLTGLGMTK